MKLVFSISKILVASVLVSVAVAQNPPPHVVIDANAPASPFPHFWEQMFGPGRAILSLRGSYRNDMREVKKVTEFRYVRFDNILHDEVGVYDQDKNGNPVYNFTYVDQIYDGLLANGVRPVVEISFMPKRLALHQDVYPFWYRPIVSPPKDYARWDDLIRHFAQHLVDRYGIDKVAQWYFEVWNEPNIDFWQGPPKQATYFELYDHTARALKSVSPRLRVGGPATSSAHWVDDFIAHTRLANPSDVLVTRRKKRSLVVALWNLVEMDQLKNGHAETVAVDFKGVNPNATVSVLRLDSSHGNTQGTYDAMGRPRYPTQAQIKELNEASDLGPPRKTHLTAGRLNLPIPVNGLVLVEVQR